MSDDAAGDPDVIGVVYWSRVKEIMEGLMDRWKERWGREPAPGIHVYYWETPQELAESVLSGLRAIEPGLPARETNFVKALALGADGVAIANSALQAIGCLGMRACHTNNCPVGIATPQKGLRARLLVEESARRLHNYLTSSVELMKVLARACGHDRLSDFNVDDLTTWKRDMADLTGVAYGGVSR